jgi:hypothetical protein
VARPGLLTRQRCPEAAESRVSLVLRFGLAGPALARDDAPVECWGDLRIVDVASLPAFHNPFRCGRRDVFDQAIRDAVTARRSAWQIWRPSVRRLVAALRWEEIEPIPRLHAPSAAQRRSPNAAGASITKPIGGTSQMWPARSSKRTVTR